MPNTVIRQIHRRSAHGRKHAGRAALELHQSPPPHRADRAAAFANRRDASTFADRSGKIHERIEHVQPGSGHAAARRFAGIVAPAALHARRMFVGEIALDMQDFARVMPSATTRLSSRMHGKHRLLLPRAKGTPAFFAGRDGAFGFSASESERLFAPDRLAGCGDRGNLPDMQGMRGCEKNRLHAGIGNGLFEFGRQFEASWPAAKSRTSSGSLLTPRMKRRRLLLP